MGVRIVTDTSCDLSPGFEEELKASRVKTVSLLFHFGLEQFEDKTMSMQEFFARTASIWPKSAAPSAETYAQAFRECIEGGDQVLCITVTSKLSATYASAVFASQQFPAVQVAVVDSTFLSVAQGLLVLAATRAAQSGKTLEDVVATVEDLKQRAHFYITLDTVEFLVRGGRASRVTGVLAGLLKIRPLLTMRDGELVLVDRPRGRATAKRRLIELAMAHLPAESIAVAHIACEEEARALASEIARQTGLPEEAIMIAETGMGLATHAGPHALAIMVASKENSMT